MMGNMDQKTKLLQDEIESLRGEINEKNMQIEDLEKNLSLLNKTREEEMGKQATKVIFTTSVHISLHILSSEMNRIEIF